VKAADRLELRTLAFALLATLLLWNLPVGGVLLYPFKLLATWLHESSHGLAMMVTRVGFDHMHIFRDTSGLAYGGAEPHQLARIQPAAQRLARPARQRPHVRELHRRRTSTHNPYKYPT
jgi:hypothetical protein